MADGAVETKGRSDKKAEINFLKLTAISPEVISKQATINIGTIGHVAHGKSTVVKALSGVQTVRFKNELERNITIKLASSLPSARLQRAQYVTMERFQINMEKGKASRDLLTDIENKEQALVNKPTTKVITEFFKQVPANPQQQVVVDGRIKCDSVKESKDLPTGEDLLTQEEHSAEEETASVASSKKADRKRSRSASSVTSEDNRVTKKPKRKPRKKAAGGRKRKPMKPFYSIDARDTETRQIESGTENPDLTVGLTAEDEYEVDFIVDRIFHEDKYFYLIHWKGWPDEHDSWEPEENLEHSRKILKVFHNSYKEKLLVRFREIAKQVPELIAFDGKVALYERDVVANMTKDDYQSIFNLPEDKEEELPTFRLLHGHIKKVMAMEEPSPELEMKIKRMILTRERVRLQYEQQINLKKFVDSLNKVNGNDLLYIENQVDLSWPPICFKPLNKNQPHHEITIPDDPPIGCECDHCDSKSKCCPSLAAGHVHFEFAYQNRLLKLRHGKPIYECNKTCKCSEDCGNRVLQHGSKVKLKIFRTRKMGWGVMALEDIPQGHFVCEYIGEVLARWAVHARQETDYRGRPNYVFDLDFNPVEDSERFDKEGYEILPYSIDATVHGNVSHFINHSCEPNLGVYVVFVNCLDPQLPHLGMYAIKDIKAGEQIFFDYTAQSFKKRRSNKKNQARGSSSKYDCACGAPNCRAVSFEPAEI